MATAKIQTVKGAEWRFFAEQKILLGLDGLDSRNGCRTRIVFNRKMLQENFAELTAVPLFRLLEKLKNLGYNRINFPVGYAFGVGGMGFDKVSAFH